MLHYVTNDPIFARIQEKKARPENSARAGLSLFRDAHPVAGSQEEVDRVGDEGRGWQARHLASLSFLLVEKGQFAAQNKKGLSFINRDSIHHGRCRPRRGSTRSAQRAVYVLPRVRSGIVMRTVSLHVSSPQRTRWKVTFKMRVFFSSSSFLFFFTASCKPMLSCPSQLDNIHVPTSLFSSTVDEAWSWVAVGASHATDCQPTDVCTLCMCMYVVDACQIRSVA